jgi:hypothetical protein
MTDRYIMRETPGSFWLWDVIDRDRSQPGRPWYILVRVEWRVAVHECVRRNAAPAEVPHV